MNPSACMQTAQPSRKFSIIATNVSAPINRAVQAPKCSACNLRERCLPRGLDEMEAEQADELVQGHKQIKRGETLYRSDNPFRTLYAVRSGFLKTSVIMQDGREQITGFHMAGDIVGMDGMGTERHTLTAIALEDTQLCPISIERIENISSQVPKLQRELHRLLSREIVRDQGLMMLLGSMRSEERMAVFLLNLSQRFVQLGYSSTEFHLRMTREDIGSYLGLTIETISRIFSKFQESGILDVQNRHIHILDMSHLRAVATSGVR